MADDINIKHREACGLDIGLCHCKPDPDIQQWTSTQDKPDTSLSLLVIDAGECCFLKVESGRYERKLFDDDMGGLGFRIIGHPFTAVRDAIDSQDKPVPRIERADVSGNERYRVVWNDSAYPIPVNVLDALSGVVGKPLPICEPTEGKWTLLKGSEIPGIAMYRYTRGGE